MSDRTLDRGQSPPGGDSSRRLTDSRLANVGARAIHRAFGRFQTAFAAITRRAQKRFVTRDWPAMQTDARERLDLYKNVVDQTVDDVRATLEDRVEEKLVWASMKAVYSGLIADGDDWELAETFFNSITRRIFATVGVDPQIEFVNTDYDSPPNQAARAVYATHQRAASTSILVETVLRNLPFADGLQNLARDAELAAREIDERLREIGALRVVERVEMVDAIFYRGKGAYLVGRIFSGSHRLPLVLALLHPPEGIILDAVLLDENEVSILFSFARSYFHVDVRRPYDLVHFLKTIIPRKRTAELYISIGYNKHGKTELYRDILHYLSYSQDRFEIARGQPGMVMSVFTMPGYDLVFKVIKDRFGFPKKTTRQTVMEKYHLVFKHDRAGRLVDAQEFEHLQFDRDRFSQPLLDELREAAGQTVVEEDNTVIIRHAYVERRIIPLDIYVHEADDEAASAAIVEYGNAIKDLAVTNIFPGDMLLKNFGVTRHGRVVFYDYDELCLLTECNVRRIPPPRTPEEELSPEPWFAIHENDVFPEQFATFIGIYGRLRDLFLAHHADLLTVPFWRDVQARLKAGEIISIIPYAEEGRLQNRYPEAFKSEV
ncbi:MAG: bifunctional isocitrate dehydrogenase kinase/phosphatase [Candidatus Promineifilaceae bacterium]|nr:bifunctional isocitrate dehydrogenase kinase/phosphatase [Candidatus Promineifilaceae bacterium]